MQQIDNISEASRSSFIQRQALQRASLNLPFWPFLPTTNIGSFPQTADIQAAHKHHKTSQINQAQYNYKIKAKSHIYICKQEALNLDVLVLSEVERNDMVEYFGQQQMVLLLINLVCHKVTARPAWSHPLFLVMDHATLR